MAAAKKAPAKPVKKTTKKAEKKAPRVAQPQSNGITRPKDGTTTGTIWGIADKLSSKGNPATRADVIAEAEKKGINEATVATQYQRWRQFNGLPGRAPAAPKAKKAPAKKSSSKKSGAKKTAPAAPAAPTE